ncbi:MAG: hypothetical protein OXG62_02435, partial [Nitrospinae bacterium]|nr:hypothetical protein [Nitrospinota bacterium]
MTFREKSITRLYAFAMAAVFALVLAGCGGGGGGTAQTPDPGTTPPEMCPEGHTGTPPNCVSPEQQEANALAAAKTAAATAATNAANAVSAVEEIKEHDPDSYANAQTAAALAAQANTQAQAATTSAAAQAAQAIAESAASDAMKYAGMVTTAKNTADAKAEQVKMNKVAQTKIDAIGAEKTSTAVPFDATSGTTGEYTVS